MGSMAYQITSLTIAYSAVYSGAEKRKYQIPASLAFVNSPHKRAVRRKMFPFDDVIMISCIADHFRLVQSDTKTYNDTQNKIW